MGELGIASAGLPVVSAILLSARSCPSAMLSRSTLRRRELHDQDVDPRVRGQDIHDRIDLRAIRSNVDWVGIECPHRAEELPKTFVRRRREGRDSESRLAERIGDSHRLASHASRNAASVTLQPGEQDEGFQRIDGFLERAGDDGPGLDRGGAPKLHGLRQGRGVGRRRSAATFCLPALPDNHGLLGGCLTEQTEEPRPILQAFDIQRDSLGLGVGA